MSAPGSIAWFAGHEARLAWRDWLSLMTAGQRRRTRTVILGFLAYAVFMHGLATAMLAHSPTLAASGTPAGLAAITVSVGLTWSLMLSQALESATRAFYARGDLDLILTSPVASWRLFAVRIASMSVTIAGMTLVLTAPFINVAAWLAGPRLLFGYLLTLALAMVAVALAVLMTVAMFQAIGPRRTRAVSQVAAAIIGAGFVISMQFAAFASYTTPNGAAVLPTGALLRLAPDMDNPVWWPARAAFGDVGALAALAGLAVLLLGAVILVFAPRFGRLALDTLRLAEAPARRGGGEAVFRSRTPGQALRRKEWTLLLRDPWLMSQTLMQLLYLAPAGFLLWRNFYAGTGSTALLVPILVVTAGQLGGGLAWLAVSGEDAPELIATAPVRQGRVLRAKVEAVLGGIALVFAPFLLLLATAAPFPALVTLAGITVAAGSATAIQYWFRTQAKRRLFRQRQTSSRIATFAEALSSIGWAGTFAMAASGNAAAVVPGLFVLAMLTGTWLLSPARGPAAA